MALSIQHCCLLGSILNYRGRKQIVDDHFSTAPDCCQRWPALTEDSPRNINTASASSSASDGVLQQDHRIVDDIPHCIRRIIMQRGRERLVWWRSPLTNWRQWWPIRPHPIAHMGAHDRWGAAIGLYRPLSPPIVHRCSPWWLLVDSGLLLHLLVYFSEKQFIKNIINWPTTTKTKNTWYSR